jgi:hypothetical protein
MSDSNQEKFEVIRIGDTVRVLIRINPEVTITKKGEVYDIKRSTKLDIIPPFIYHIRFPNNDTTRCYPMEVFLELEQDVI